MGFTQPLDIWNRGMQFLGIPQISSTTENTKQQRECSFCYDKLRRAELRRAPWRFATRRATLRPLTATTQFFQPAAWASGSNYLVGQLVVDAVGTYWICLVAHSATAINGPGSVQVPGPQNWQEFFGTLFCDTWTTSAGNTYNLGELVYLSQTAKFYLSLINGNTGSPDSTSWVALMGAGLPALFFTVAGPGVKLTGRARNLFPLPTGYLRAREQDDGKAPGSTNLGTSAGLRFSDMQIEDNYFVSQATTPQVFRFGADITDVTRMDDLFCDGLAHRIAYELAETLTNSSQKVQLAGAAYRLFISDARLINWLEVGNTEPQEEDYEAEKVARPQPTPQGGRPSNA